MIVEIEKARIECVEAGQNGMYGKFVIEPLELGFGHTLGNSMRRVLLSSLPGVAVSSVHIEGVQHEFSTIPGIKEDVTEIILNLKTMAVQMFAEGPKTLTLDFQGPMELNAGDIKTDDEVEIVNKDLHIANRTVIYALSAVDKSVTEEGQTLFGMPAIEANKKWREMVYHRQLPNLFEEVKQLKQEITDLKSEE